MNKTSAHREKMGRLYEQNAQIVATNRCPDCGSALRRNRSMAGWWQCGQFGSERSEDKVIADAAYKRGYTEGRGRIGA